MKGILCSLFFLTALSVAAQNNYIGKSDPEATAILKKLSSKYKNLKSLTANVSLVAENSQGQKVSSQSGQLFLKGNKYYLQMPGDVSFSDGVNIYNYDKSAKEIQITKVNIKDKTITPQRLFTDFYQKDFLYKLNDEEIRNGRKIQEIELTPIDKTQPYFKILLEIDKATNSLSGAKVFEKNGNKYFYNITSARLNVPLEDSKFVYDKNDFSGVEVIDLR